MTAVRSRARSVADAVLAALFVALICLPTLRSLTQPSPAQVGAENRPPAPAPEWRWKPEVLTVFPAKFEAFFDDRFGYRDLLVRWLSLARVRWLHTSPSAKVVVGKKGWLYYTETPVGRDYDSVRPFTGEELAYWKQTLEQRRDWLAARGMRYYFVIAPDKQTIYPEMLPAALRPRHGSVRLDQLQAYLRAHSDFRILDLRAPLLEAKDRERLFCLTDSHWNDHAAYLAYRSLMATLAESFPGMEALPRAAFVEGRIPGRGGDLARMLGLGDRYREEYLVLNPRTPRRAHPAPLDPQWHVPEWRWPVLTERPGPQLPRAVMFRDSFAACMIPFLSEHFRRIFYYREEPTEFEFDVVEREKPDLVIQETVERKLLGSPIRQ